ncbi:acyltransferase [Curvivirga sp.]|uniref:acyltransferase n=1 Tax=Curvivirga sp. TaxID=2856848 RepID=UPI003B595DFE
MKEDEFISLLHKSYNRLDSNLIDEYHRSLSFQDALFDRWERANKLGFGDGASIYNSAAVFGSVEVGKKTWIGPNCILDGSGGKLCIGDTCSISAGVQIYTHDTVAWALTGGKRKARQAPVEIGSNTYIGSQSIIVAGVKIGSGSVIAASSVVNVDVPDNSIYGGVPVQRLGSVEIVDDSPILLYDSGKKKIL